VRSFCPKVIGLLLAFLFSFLLLEIGIRTADAVRGRSRLGRAHWYWVFEQDPFLGYRGRANIEWPLGKPEVAHNTDGFRDDRNFEQLTQISREGLIFCVGESSTYGLSATSNGNSYPAQLEKALNAAFTTPVYHVFNAGMPGYTSFEMSNLIRLRLLKFKPKAIVLMSLRNDHEFVSCQLNAEQDYNSFPLRLAQLSKSSINEIGMSSAVFSFFASRLRSSYIDDLGGRPPRRPESHPTPRGLDFYRQNLEVIHLACTQAGVQLICVDQPVKLSSYSEERQRSLELMRNVLAEFCNETRTPLLAAQSLLPFSDLQMEDDVHLGNKGYQLLAELLAPQVHQIMIQSSKKGNAKVK
jgi:lysophospholipase L1-like esterase